MKPPDNERRVLTWVQDSQGIEGWQLDSYSRGYSGNFWLEAQRWGLKVLHWQDLPPKPDYEEGE